MRRRSMIAFSLMAIAAAPIAAPFCIGDAEAHRARLALTTIVWRPDPVSGSSATAAAPVSGELHVTHELHAHDALQVLSFLNAGNQRLELADIEAQAKLAIAVEKAFSVTEKTSGPVALETIGAEIAGNYVYVFQTARLERPPVQLTVANSVFRDVFPDQVNQTNLSVGGVERSLTFADDDGVKSVAF